MKYYFAPLEGITGYIYRRAHHAFYPGLDQYFTPFIVPKEKKYLSTKERNDVLPDNNQGMTVIPQIMTNQPDEFLRISQLLHKEYGYKEINLNLGCPSKTVVSKKRGSGFLTVPDQLEKFLTQVCSGLEPYGIKLSVKTRIGKKEPDEFCHLLEIYRKFPLSKLIVHPRVQEDFYNNVPNLEAFSRAYAIDTSTDWELCYNGDIFCMADYQNVCKKYSELSAIMIGRGLLINPMLVEEIKVRENGGNKNEEIKVRENGGNKNQDENIAVLQRFSNEEKEKAERKRRYEMYRMLLDDYMTVMSGEKNVLFKMKELWFYMSQDFTKSQRYWKKMKKAQRLSEFERVVNALCMEQKLLENISNVRK